MQASDLERAIARSGPADRMSLGEFVHAILPLLAPSISLYGSAFILLLVVARSAGAGTLRDASAAIFLFMLASPAGAIQAAIATRVWPGGTMDGGEQPPLSVIYRRIAPFAVAWTLFAGAVLAGAALLLDPRDAPLLSLWPAVALSLCAAVPLGHLYATDRSRVVVPLLWTTGVVRLGIGSSLVLAHVDATIAVAVSLTIAEAVSVGVGLWRAGHGTGSTRATSSDRFFLGGTFRGITLAAMGLALLSGIDVLAACYRLGQTAAGRYAGLAVLGRIVLFVPLLAVVPVMPHVGALQRVAPLRWLSRSVGFAAVATAVVSLVITAFRTQVTSLVLGAQFRPSADLLPFMAAAGGLLAIVWQLSLFHKTVRSRAHGSNIVLASVFGVLATTFAVSSMKIALLMLAVTASAALFQYLGARAICRWSPPLSLLSAHEEIVAAAPHGPTAVELSVILPCRNAGRAVREFLGKLIEQLAVIDGFEVIVVSDGSTDDTVEIAREFASPAVRVFHYPRGSGKGHALRVGLSKARGQYIGYIDSDGDIDPEAIGPFISLMNLYGLDIVLGSKRHPMSEVDYPILRRWMSWVYHKVARILFMVPVRDTQTGFKVIRREVLDAVLPRMLEKRYAFDLELLVVARLLGYKKVFEAPVRITYQFSSQVVPATALRILIDTLAIFYRRYILNTYRYAGDRLVVDVQGADERDGLIQEM